MNKLITKYHTKAQALSTEKRDTQEGEEDDRSFNRKTEGKLQTEATEKLRETCREIAKKPSEKL